MWLTLAVMPLVLMIGTSKAPKAAAVTAAEGPAVHAFE